MERGTTGVTGIRGWDEAETCCYKYRGYSVFGAYVAAKGNIRYVACLTRRFFIDTMNLPREMSSLPLIGLTSEPKYIVNITKRVTDKIRRSER